MPKTANDVGASLAALGVIKARLEMEGWEGSAREIQWAGEAVEALVAERDRLLAALRRLEQACDQVAASRTQTTYLAMIDSGQGDDLLALDEARAHARSHFR